MRDTVALRIEVKCGEGIGLSGELECLTNANVFLEGSRTTFLNRPETRADCRSDPFRIC